MNTEPLFVAAVCVHMVIAGGVVGGVVGDALATSNSPDPAPPTTATDYGPQNETTETYNATEHPAIAAQLYGECQPVPEEHQDARNGSATCP